MTARSALLVLTLVAPALAAVVPAASSAHAPVATLTLFPRLGGDLDALPGDADAADPRTIATAFTSTSRALTVPLALDQAAPLRVHLANRTAAAPGTYETVVSVRLLDRDARPVLDASGAPVLLADERFVATRGVDSPPTGPGWTDFELPLRGPATIAPSQRIQVFVGPGRLGATSLEPDRMGPAHAFHLGRDDARTSVTFPLLAQPSFAEFVAAERVGGGLHPLVLVGAQTKTYRIDAAVAAVGAWATPELDPFVMRQRMELYDRDGALVESGASVDAGFREGPLVLRVRAQTPPGAPIAFAGEVLIDVDTAPRDDAGSGRDAGATGASAVLLGDGTYVGHLGPGDAVDAFSLDLERGQVFEVSLTMPDDAEFALNGRESGGTTLGFKGVDNWGRASRAVITVSRVSGHGDYTLSVARDPGTGPAPPLSPIATSEWVTGLATTPDGFAITNFTGVWTWTPQDGATLAHPGDFYGLRAVADGFVTSTTVPANVVVKLDAQGQHPVVPGRYVQGPDPQGNVYYWNWSTGLHRRTPAGTTEAMVQPCAVEQGLLRCAHLFAFAPDGRTYAWRDLGETLYEADLTTGLHRALFTLPGLKIAGVAFAQDGAVYIAGAATGYVLRYSPADGSYTTVARTHEPWIGHIAAWGDKLYVATFNDTTLVSTIATIEVGPVFAGHRPTMGPIPVHDVAVAKVRVEVGATPTERVVTVTVRNEGEAPTPPTKLRLREGVATGGTNQSVAAIHGPVFARVVPALEPGASVDVVIRWETRGEAGEQWLRVSVDETGFLSDEVVAEVDEADNVRYERVVLFVDAPVGI